MKKTIVKQWVILLLGICFSTGLLARQPVLPTGEPSAEKQPRGGNPAAPAPTTVSPNSGNGAFGGRKPVVLIDQILVVVDNDVVTAYDLAARLDYVSRQLKARGVELPPAEILEKQLLERMVLERLQLQRARELGIRVTEEQLNQIIRRIIDAQLPGASVADFEASLRQDGINFAYFKQDLTKEVLISMLREQEIDSKVQVSNEEVDSFLINQKADQEKEVHISQIVVNVSEGLAPDQVKLKETIAQKVADQLAQGVDFKQLAIQYSDGQDAAQGGDLGWKPLSNLPLLYVDALAKAQDNEVMGPIRSVAGVHFIKLHGRRVVASKPEMVTQYRVNHILIRPDENLSIDSLVDRLKSIREKLVANPSLFADMAKQYSQDASSVKGGSIGWVSPGDTVPEFEAVLATLSINEISQPVQSSYGWHLIQVVDTRMADLGDTRRRNAAKAAIKERKVDEAYQQWLNELRDEAFVEYKQREDMR